MKSLFTRYLALTLLMLTARSYSAAETATLPKGNARFPSASGSSRRIRKVRLARRPGRPKETVKVRPCSSTHWSRLLPKLLRREAIALLPLARNDSGWLLTDKP